MKAVTALVLASLLTTAVDAAPATPTAPAPPHRHRIAELWFAHNAMTVMLGAADQVRVTVVSPQAQPWMFRVAPVLSAARRVANGPANAEALLADKVDLAFVSAGPEAERLNRLGVPTKHVDFTDIAAMRASLRTTATAIGTPLAALRARDYDNYLTQTQQRLVVGLRGLPTSRRPRVLHLASLSPLRADGADTLIDSWITLAGGRNAATGLTGNMQAISPEQIARWNPDIIIVGGQAKAANDRPWATMPILAGRRVVRNPMGVFPWDRYGPEFALQLQWTAKLLHPERFPRLNIAQETADFYRRFFGYRLNANEYDRIAHALPPAPRG